MRITASPATDCSAHSPPRVATGDRADEATVDLADEHRGGGGARADVAQRRLVVGRAQALAAVHRRRQVGDGGMIGGRSSADGGRHGRCLPQAAVRALVHDVVEATRGTTWP
jgi:hypothetical protein